MPRPAYAPHEDFIDPARGNPSISLLILGVLVIELFYLASVHLMEPFLILVPLASPSEVSTGSTPRGLLIQLTSFLVLAFAVILVSRRLHGRGFVSLIGPPQVATRQLLLVTLVLVVVVMVAEFIPPDLAMLRQANMRPLQQWLLLLPLALTALLIQTGAEELFYRGYVQQQIAARFSQPWVWLVLPSLLFASAHYSPDLPMVEMLQYMCWAFVFGLAAADLTARSGTLGPAIGFHLVNNALAFLIYGEAGGVDSGLTLFLFPYEMPAKFLIPQTDTPDSPPFDPGALISPDFLFELVGVGIFWAGARIALRR